MHGMRRSACLSVFGCLILYCGLAPTAVLAGATHEEFDLPLPPLFVDCLGEEVEGLLHVREVGHVRFSANGFHMTYSSNVLGVIVGLSSGSTWSLRGVHNFSANGTGTPEEQLTFNAVTHLTAVSPENPTLVFTNRVVLTVDANGVLRSYHFTDTVRCQGNQN